MEITCLSEGKGFYFPACHILDICGFRILFDCPMDLSSLSIFSPIDPHLGIYHGECTSSQNYVESEVNVKERHEVSKPLDATSLIHAEPFYRTMKNLLLWNVSFIDAILISSPMGMMGLPFLTRNKDFTCKVYATEAAARIGKLMMEDLVTMHKEFRQYYGPVSGAPQWMKWEELENLPLELKQIVLGAEGTDFGVWMSLYSAADVKDCMARIKTLKYGEETCYNGTLIMKALSSGLDIGSCNWSIKSPKGSMSYISSSVPMSATTMNLDVTSLRESDVLLYSDISSCCPRKFEDDQSSSAPNLSDDMDMEASFTIQNSDEYLEEIEKLDFICSCSMDAVKARGSVLIPIGRLGVILQLLEHFALGLESENIKVPIFVISSVAEELMAYTNIIPEWLCKERQERLYSGQALFTHMEMLKDGRLQIFPSLDSLKLLTSWQEPCIVFCPHWSFRLGPVTHLVRRWSNDPNSLLVMEEGADANLALLPFQPIAMKVLQCSFISGLQSQQAQSLLRILQPKVILFSEVLKGHIGHLESSISFEYYSENKTINIPMEKDPELNIGIEVVTQFDFTTLKHDMDTSRLKGELLMENGRLLLLHPGNNQKLSKLETKEQKPVVHFGRMDLDALLKKLENTGLNVRVEEVKVGHGELQKGASILHILEPNEGLIEVTEVQTTISTVDEDVASLISQAVCSTLDSF